ncbi:MAG: VanZ family protein [Gammaproteobacteria bacterium]|nr:VanZ family protein [Gammaproteobacteria bacterium]
MLPLRFGRVWLAAGFLFLGVGLYSALTPNPGGLALLNDKLVHGAGFMAFMLWFGGIVEPRRVPRVALALALYGLLIELLQSLTATRQAEFLDLAADVAGVLLGWLLGAAGLSRWCTVLESWLVPRRH